MINYNCVWSWLIHNYSVINLINIFKRLIDLVLSKSYSFRLMGLLLCCSVQTLIHSLDVVHASAPNSGRSVFVTWNKPKCLPWVWISAKTRITLTNHSVNSWLARNELKTQHNIWHRPAVPTPDTMLPGEQIKMKNKKNKQQTEPNKTHRVNKTWQVSEFIIYFMFLQNINHSMDVVTTSRCNSPGLFTVARFCTKSLWHSKSISTLWQ